MKLRIKHNSIIGIFPLVLLFGVLYSCISFVNHYYFRTYALDLGAYTNALYDYIHFQWNDSSVFKELKENLLADHFDLYLILFSPLSLVFGTYTLLIIQIIAILFGGYGIYRYFTISEETRKLALSAALYYYLFFGVFSALATDYHSNVVAASLVPWFAYLLKKNRMLPAGLVLAIILVSKENISLWMTFVSLGLAIEYWHDKTRRSVLLGFSLVCVLYFITVTAVVMPYFSRNNTYPHFNYLFLGMNSYEAIMFLIKHPLESFQAIFINHTSNPTYDYIKAEFHLLILISGLPLLIFKPRYILMLIPLYFQKLFHDNVTIWGIHGQYSIEFAPILAMGIFSFIAGIKNNRYKTTVTIAVIIGALICTIRIMDHTILYTNKAMIRFYQGAHYTRNYDVKNVHAQLLRIPGNAVVSAQSPFLPHLSLRDNIYQFPIIKNAEYVIYSRKEGPYPIRQEEFATLTASLENSPDWGIEYKSEDLVVLRRNHLRGPSR